MTKMTPLKTLHYAIGQLAYAVAFADGEIQKNERQRFCNTVTAELQKEHYDFEVSEIIFSILDGEHRDPAENYHSAMEKIRLNSQYLSPQLKNSFMALLENVAEAHPPVTPEELSLIERVRSELDEIIPQ